MPERASLPAHGARRVCVIGGGPAGLSAARALEAAGHHVIVIEAAAAPGGKCESVAVGEHVFDLGGHICTTRYAEVAELARKLGVATEPTTPHRLFDREQRTARPQRTALFRPEVLQRYAALRSQSFADIGAPGLAQSAASLAAPVGDWLERHHLHALRESLGTGYTAAGYGYLEGDLPALYLVKYAEMTGLLSSVTDVLGPTGSFTIQGGFQSLWKAVAAGLRDVRCGVRAAHIERSDSIVRVHLADGDVIEADDLVLAVPLGEVLGALDASETERDIAGRVRTQRYSTTLCTISGLPTSGFYLVEPNAVVARGDGQCVSFHHRYVGDDVYACYAYGAEGQDDEAVLARLGDDVRAMGGKIEAVHTHRAWSFLPHFGSADVAGGVLDRLEALQGTRRTWYVGGLLAFELVECVVAHAHALVARHFAASARGAAPELSTPSASREREALLPSGPVTASTVRAWLQARIAAALEVDPSAVDCRASLLDYSLDSLAIVSLFSNLSSWVGWEVPPSIVLELSTIDAFAEHFGAPSLAAPERAPARPRLVHAMEPIRPFFCIGGVLGNTHPLRPLARRLARRRPVFGVQAPGYDGSEAPLSRVEDLARRYCDEIRATQPAGPYLVGGHSFGGLVAWEVARQLAAQGEEIERVLLIDAYVAEPGQRVPPPNAAAAIDELITMHRYLYGEGAAQELGDAATGDISLSERCRRVARALGAADEASAEMHVARILGVYEASLEAVVLHEPRAADLPATLFKARGGFPPVLEGDRSVRLFLDDPSHGWTRVGLSRLDVVTVPGQHFDMLVEPHVDALAAAIDACLSR